MNVSNASKHQQKVKQHKASMLAARLPLDCTVPCKSCQDWVCSQPVQCLHDSRCLAGRKSGIWLGSADVQLGNIQQQWNQYKVHTLVRHEVSLSTDARLT
jgi:hypothetical protein